MVDGATVDTEPVPGTPAWWKRREAVGARRRPRSEGLTLERMIVAALALIDREGLDALTMRRLAGDLGAGAASLYRHVANRDELLVEVMDSVLGEMRTPPDDGGWRDTSEWMACEFRRVLVEHRGVIPLLSQDPLLGPNAMRGREAALGVLLGYGFGQEEAGRIYSMVVAWVLGFTMLTSSAAGQLTVEGTPRAELFAAYAQGEYPLVSGMASEGRLPGGDEETVFRLGLATLLDGIDVRYPRHPG